MITISNLSKSFPSGFSLGPLNLSLEGAECTAVLGRNGAGKSTFFNLITGFLDPTEGEVQVLDQRAHAKNFKLRRQIGYLPQQLMLPLWVTGQEILNYTAHLYGIAEVEITVKHVAEKWDCVDYLHKPIAACSHGMKKRIGLAQVFMSNPHVAVLDEPFSGLDLYHIQALKDEINERRTAGHLTILSTHILPYIAEICNRVFFIDQGQLEKVQDWTQLSLETRIKTMEKRFFSEGSP